MQGKTFRKIFIAICIAAVICCGVAGFVFYKIYSPVFGITENFDVYIDQNSNFDKLMQTLKNEAKLKNPAIFEQTAKFMKFLPENLKTGHYVVTPKMSAVEAVRMFRNGHQTPVKIKFNNIRLKRDFAEKIAEQLMFDKDEFFNKLNNPDVCRSFGLDTTTIITLFIPNTYEMYWNISIDNFLDRMKREHERFWTDARKAKAAAIPLTQPEVATLASIVEEETALASDYPIVAGLYINRLRKGMKLQADPTVKFAVGDFSLRRILYAHLDTDSPYNTYKYKGLPPGPIRIPSIATIDAVLNYTHHNYLFMTAKEDFSGKTNFAETLAEHSRNARKYQDALNKKGIR
jgi:UPF0755 protein